MPHPSAVPQAGAQTTPVVTDAKSRTNFVRSARRHELSIRGLLSIAPASTAAVRWSAAAGAREGVVEVDAIDLSKGGMGLIGLVFLPRGTVVRVKLLAPTSEAQVLLDVCGIIRRVAMIDRRPAYQFGVSFGDLGPEVTKDIERLLALLHADDDEVVARKEATNA
jgi:hypothetical protein